MKHLIAVVILCALAFGSLAAGADSDAPVLPAEAAAQVSELTSKMRYFKAIGFHKQSKEKRDEIIAIYDQHGVPVPEEYKKDD